MKVIPIAHTQFLRGPGGGHETGYRGSVGDFPEDADELAEVSGRLCYQSWNRPNPKTATNEGYLSNILDQGHFSVLEHASVSFYVEGVSRSLLTELERHRFISFSVVSQRYVRMKPDNVVIPPAIAEHADVVAYRKMYFDGTIADEFEETVSTAFESYDRIADSLLLAGLPKKQALEAARSVLPNATEVKMVVTGNIRAWRDVIGKRYHESADAEIQEFATEVLGHLRTIAPNSVQDIPEEPFK